MAPRDPRPSHARSSESVARSHGLDSEERPSENGIELVALNRPSRNRVDDPELAHQSAVSVPPEELAGRESWWAKWRFEIKLIVALLLPVYVETLDYTVVASAQPQIASAFGRLDLQTWVGTSYVLTSTAFLPLCSNIADILGRHTTLQVGFVIFFVGSVVSTAAQNMPMVLAGRGLSGVGAAFLLTVVRVIFADNRSLNTNTYRTALMSLLFAVGYSTGPIIGGALSSINFRWIFAINLPIALLGSVLAFLTVRHALLGPRPDPRDSLPGWRTSSTHRPSLIIKLTRIDWIGSFLFTAGSILVLIGLSWGSTETHAWSKAKVIAALVTGSVLIVVFIGWEMYLGLYEVRFQDAEDGVAPIPIEGANAVVDHDTGEIKPLRVPPRFISHTQRMLPLWIFRNHQIPIVFFSAFSGGMVMFGCLYFLSIYWSIVAGFENTKAGTQLVFLTPGLGGGVWIASAMVSWWRQPRIPIMMGQTIQAVGVGILGLAISQNHHGQINGFLAVCGLGIGLTTGTLEMQARFILPREQTSVSTTMNLFFRTAGGTIGLAQLSAVLESKLRSYIASLISSGKLSYEDAISIAQGLSSTGGDNSSGPGIDQLSPALQQVIKDAYQYGVKWAFYSLLPWCCVSALIVFSLGKIVDTDRVEKERKEEEKRKAAEDREKMQGSLTTDPESGVAGGDVSPGTDTAPDSSNLEAEPKPKKRVGYGPRYRGPFMYLVYGVELLIGTRQRMS